MSIAQALTIAGSDNGEAQEFRPISKRFRSLAYTA